MKIVLAEHFGMCFGVRDAIAQAERTRGAGAAHYSRRARPQPDRARTASRARRD